MKNLIIAPVVLSLLAVTLTGCNDDDDPIFGSGGSSNDFTVNRFDKSYDNQANGEAVARIENKFRTGAREINIKNIVNNYNNQGPDALDRIVLADRFEGNLDNKNIEVKRNVVQRPIYEKNSNKKINFETDYQMLDLSSAKANSYTVGSTISNSRGIITDLNNYTKIPKNASFPSGSVCYIPVTTSEVSFLSFNNKNRTEYKDINKWAKATEKRFSDNRKYSTATFNVGNSNKNKAAQVKFFATNKTPEYLYSGVDYDNSIYQTDYIAKGTNNPNTDSTRGVVDCTLVNNTAADFLEREIRRYY